MINSRQKAGPASALTVFKTAESPVPDSYRQIKTARKTGGF